MTQQELEERLGRKVSQEEYVNANAIYMACDFEKDEFCRMYRKSEGKLVQNLSDNYYKMKFCSEEDEKKLRLISTMLMRILDNNGDEEQRDEVRRILGEGYFVRLCIANGFVLDQSDRELVLRNLKL